MPSLLPAAFVVDLKPAKANGLAELGVPTNDATEVKKGKLAEAMQMIEGGEQIGRRYQNLRAVLVKTTEGARLGVKLVLSFELFGDDNTPAGVPAALSAQLWSGDTQLADLPLGVPFLPYGSFWYENRFAANLPLESFAAADRVVLAAAADEVRAL